MTRFSFVFLFVAMSMLNNILLNPRLSSAAAAAAAVAAAAAAVTYIPLDASETPAFKSDEVEYGISGAKVNERIIGGDEAEPHAWPWQALLVCNRGGDPFQCGGSLVADKWVITAAHCVFDMNECEVFLGKHYSSTSDEVEPTQVKISMEKYFVHDQYNSSLPSLGSDIALVKLSKSVEYDENIKAICFPFGLPELTDTAICYATGWGRDDRTNERQIPETLKQLEMPIHEDYSYCKLDAIASELKICAGSWDREDDLCQGDSGGPLSCKEADGNWFLRGVTSYGTRKCNSVTIFTKVTAFQDWIQEKICE